MDAEVAKSFGAVELEGVLHVLAKSKKACDSLQRYFGEDK